MGKESVIVDMIDYDEQGHTVYTEPGVPISWNAPQSPENPDAGYGYIADDTTEEETFFYHSDHLGSTSYITDDKGNITQYDAYLPYGELLIDEHSSSEEMPYKFNGKELDEETGLYYYGARYLNPISSVWYGTDLLFEKYPSVSPYVYCLGNPVNAIDTDGRKVKPTSLAELTMIHNTLPMDARRYVRLDENGFIDSQLLNSYNGKSLNYSNLKKLVNSDITVEVILDNQFTYVGKDGKIAVGKMQHYAFDPRYDLETDKDLTGETMSGLSTGESGFLGKTLFPDRDGVQNSPNENIIIIVNKNLSPAGAAEIYSHEANGHALLYIDNGGDHKGASHQPIGGLVSGGEGNVVLKNMIINSKKETIQNMRKDEK